MFCHRGWRRQGVKDKESKDGGSYGTLDGSEGQQVLGSVANVSTPGLVARVVSLLQDELLSLELGVLVAHPAAADTQIYVRGQGGVTDQRPKPYRDSNR